MRLRADCPLMVSSSERRPLSTCAKYSAATATFTVLAIGNGVLPLMLTVSPELRSSAAMPTSADLLATIELSCCSRVDRLGLEAAAAGCAANARSDSRIAQIRIALTRAQPRSPRNHHQTPTFVPNCKNFSLRDEICARLRRPRRSAPSRQPGAPQSGRFSQIALLSFREA